MLRPVNDDHEIMMITNEGIIIQFKVNTVSEIGRNTFGVKLINIDKDENIKVAKIAKVRDNPRDIEDEIVKLIDDDSKSENNTSTEASEMQIIQK